VCSKYFSCNRQGHTQLICSDEKIIFLIIAGKSSRKFSATYQVLITVCRRKYEDQEFLKPTLRMKSTSRARSSSKTEGDNPPALSDRDSMNSNRASLASSMDSLSINRDSITSKRDAITSSRDSTTSNRDSMASNRSSMASNRGSVTGNRDSMASNRGSVTGNTSSTGVSQRGTPPGSFSSFTTSPSLAPSLRRGPSLSHSTSTSTVILNSFMLPSSHNAKVIERCNLSLCFFWS
jgi:hypothetical protein